MSDSNDQCLTTIKLASKNMVLLCQKHLLTPHERMRREWKDEKGNIVGTPPPPSPLVDFCLERGGGCQKGGVSLEMGRKTEYSTLISIMVLMERVSFLRGVE